jgi:hypothetical protein
MSRRAASSLLLRVELSCYMLLFYVSGVRVRVHAYTYTYACIQHTHTHTHTPMQGMSTDTSSIRGGRAGAGGAGKTSTP